MPSIRDYGGHAHATRSGRTVPREKAETYRCCDCQTLCFVAPIEWRRAAKPHCRACGGPLEETKENVKRTLGNKRDRTKRDKANAAALAKVREAARCLACGQVLGDEACALVCHLNTHSECVYEYKADGHVVRYGIREDVAKNWIPGTASVEADGRRVVAFCADTRQMMCVARFGTDRAALLAVDRINHPERYPFANLTIPENRV